MRILSIDPGYERVGIAVLEKKSGRDKEKLLHSECFKTSSKLLHDRRLGLIGKKIRAEIKKWEPGALAIETLFFNKNQKTVMAVSEARGVIIYEASSAGLEIYEYSPLQIKIAVTGYGRGDKNQVISMVKALISIKKTSVQDDEFDAIATGLTCFASEKHNIYG